MRPKKMPSISTAETPILTRDMAFTKASVQYWEKVVEAQKA
jgi:hypothetical protein